MLSTYLTGIKFDAVCFLKPCTKGFNIIHVHSYKNDSDEGSDTSQLFRTSNEKTIFQLRMLATHKYYTGVRTV